MKRQLVRWDKVRWDRDQLKRSKFFLIALAQVLYVSRVYRKFHNERLL